MYNWKLVFKFYAFLANHFFNFFHSAFIAAEDMRMGGLCMVCFKVILLVAILADTASYRIRSSFYTPAHRISSFNLVVSHSRKLVNKRSLRLLSTSPSSSVTGSVASSASEKAISSVSPLQKVPMDLLKIVRDSTGATLPKCKEALLMNSCNAEESIRWIYLTELSSESIKKKMTRETKEGAIGVYRHHDGKSVAIVEVNCETDFVANTAPYTEFVNNLAKHILLFADYTTFFSFTEITDEIRQKQRETEISLYNEENGTSDSGGYGSLSDDMKVVIDDRTEATLREKTLLTQKYCDKPEFTIEDLIKSKILLFGENIRIKRYHTFRVGKP
jgi:elongation factor Ts